MRDQLQRASARLGALPFLLAGLFLLALGTLALLHIANNIWPVDVDRVDLVRSTARGTVSAAALLDAANYEIVLAFLTSIMVAATGFVFPLVYYLNKRFHPESEAPHFLIVLRQAMGVGFWLAFCVWLQMNRTLGLAVSLLVAAVLVMFELLLQVRRRAEVGGS